MHVKYVGRMRVKLSSNGCLLCLRQARKFRQESIKISLKC